MQSKLVNGKRKKKTPTCGGNQETLFCNTKKAGKKKNNQEEKVQKNNKVQREENTRGHGTLESRINVAGIKTNQGVEQLHRGHIGDGELGSVEMDVRKI